MSLEVLPLNNRIFPTERPQEVQITPYLGEQSRLQGTGFILPLEIKRLFKNYNQNLREGKNNEEAWAVSLGELETNIRSYILEYIQSKTVLPHKNRIERVNGVRRMVGNNGILVVDGITDQERQGGVKQASIKVDGYLSNNADSIAVINSPFGHSGFFKNDGTGITYKNNQTMVFWTDQQGELHGLTLVSDLDERQSKELSESLGVSEGLLTGQTQLERVSNIVGNPALFSYSQALKNPAEYVLDKIVSIRGDADFRLVQEDGTIEIRSVAQTRADIQRMNQLLNFNKEIEEHIKELTNNLWRKFSNLNHSIIQAEIASIIEETILNITVDYLQKTPNRYFDRLSPQNSWVSEQIRDQDKFMMAAAFLRTRAGCAGSSSMASLRGISLGLGRISLGREGLGGVCGDCGMPKDGHYHCPDCNLRFEDESNRAAGDYTPSCGCGYVFGCGTSAEADNPEEKEETQELVKAA